MNYKIEDFKGYKVRESHYEGILNEGSYAPYLKTKWSVNGEGRAISAIIQLIERDGRIIKHRIWSYDSMFKWKRKKQHKEMMLEALIWATT